jgi:hypothetical protein
MPEEARTHGEREGISRRSLIKRAAATGAVAWAAPTIIDSIASPAGAITGGFPCSYASVVCQLATGAIVAVKVNTTQTMCTNDNSTSGDANFSQVCGTGTYSNNCSGNNICRNGAEVPANTGVCPVTVSGGQVTANAGVTILFAIVHDGQCPGGHFCSPFCGPVTSFTANCGST